MNERILSIVEPVASIFPEYHPDAADINESLDPEHGVASCAVRAYAGALLLRDAFPNESLYVIDFGYSPDHGGDFYGVNGKYLKMGHAVTRLWVPEQRPLLVESYSDAGIEVVSPNDTHSDYVWGELHNGYLEYLSKAGLDDVEVDPAEVLDHLKSKIQQLQ